MTNRQMLKMAAVIPAALYEGIQGAKHDRTGEGILHGAARGIGANIGGLAGGMLGGGLGTAAGGAPIGAILGLLGLGYGGKLGWDTAKKITGPASWEQPNILDKLRGLKEHQ